MANTSEEGGDGAVSLGRFEKILRKQAKRRKNGPFKLKWTKSEDFSEMGIVRFLGYGTSVQFCFMLMIIPKKIVALLSQSVSVIPKNLWNKELLRTPIK